MATPHPAPDPREHVGDDGLTDAERQEFAERWAKGPAAKPSREEMAELRKLLAARR
jgi:hypothetical protein